MSREVPVPPEPAGPPPLLIDAVGLPPELDARVAAQIGFLVEVDRLKAVLRASPLAAVDRRENSAEHSWHLAVAVLVLAEHASEPIDLARTLELVAVHDLVEIYAGDTPEARFAKAMDRFVPLLHNWTNRGGTWPEYDATVEDVRRRTDAIDTAAPALAAVRDVLLTAARSRGWTADPPAAST